MWGLRVKNTKNRSERTNIFIWTLQVCLVAMKEIQQICRTECLISRFFSLYILNQICLLPRRSWLQLFSNAFYSNFPLAAYCFFNIVMSQNKVQVKQTLGILKRHHLSMCLSQWTQAYCLNSDQRWHMCPALRHMCSPFSFGFWGALTMKTTIKRSEIISQDPSG